MKKYLMMAAVAAMLAACNNQENVPVVDGMADTPVMLNVGVADLNSRAGYAAGPLTNGAMGFYFQQNTQGLDDATAARYTATNRKVEYTNGQWVMENAPLLWRDATTEVAWQAYYPYTDANIADGIMTATIPTDQNEDGVFDLLYAQGTTKGEACVSGLNIELKHMMSKFIVNLITGTELGDVEYESVVLTDYDTQNKFNLSNTNSGYNIGYFIFAADKPADINMIKHEGGKTFEAIIFPGTPSYIGLEIHLKDGRIFYYKQGTPKFEMGTIHTLNLKVGKDKVETGDMTSSDWSDDGSDNTLETN